MFMYTYIKRVCICIHIYIYIHKYFNIQEIQNIGPDHRITGGESNTYKNVLLFPASAPIHCLHGTRRAMIPHYCTPFDGVVCVAGVWVMSIGLLQWRRFHSYGAMGAGLRTQHTYFNSLRTPVCAHSTQCQELPR